ncbi:alpha/beta hydrolase [Uruburuella testudinis]|uniref:Alpha/beta hydrolase n=1 Tax=Uruburuella testudinis TaxID=1282863 RepID=A0ABY4DSX1_9NEIS|nr:alpha/beta hydrolase [Uruburuella testudinis]UOO81682.1 alpha/beta hydrolase [Uruburuella testudinis]
MQTRLSALALCALLTAACAAPTAIPAPANTPSKRTRAMTTPPIPLPEQTRVFKDIIYKNVNGTDLKLDLYLPAQADKPTPLIVWVHGGAWMRGDKADFPPRNSRLAAALLSEGYALASVSYRLSGQAAFPAPIQDLNDALAYLWAHAGQYGFDRDNIAIAGRSAGAHLALLAATANAQLPADFISSSQAPFHIRAAVGFFGIYDLPLMGEQKNSTAASPESRLLGGTPAALPQTARAASPVSYVGPHTPPVILLHGTDDRQAPVDQSRVLQQRLNQSGIANEIIIVEGARHGDPVFDTEPYVAQVVDFFQRHLKPSPQPR